MEKKQQAQHLYMAGGRSQREIADATGVSERTIHSWIHQYEWDKLRLAAYRAPVTIADNLCAQLVELQNDIATRPPGKRYPTLEEAEVSRKLITSLEKMKKYPSLSVNMQVLETFRNYIRPVNKAFAEQVGKYATQFLEGQSVNGYAPYQVEYGVAPVAPVSPYYEEPDDETPEDEVIPPCPDIYTCLHEGNCTYPRCEKEIRRTIDRVSRYPIPAIHYAQKTAAASGSISATPETVAAITKPPSISAKSTFARPPLMIPVQHKPGITKGVPHLSPVWHTYDEDHPHPAKTRNNPATFQLGNAENNIIRIPQLPASSPLNIEQSDKKNPDRALM